MPVQGAVVARARTTFDEKSTVVCLTMHLQGITAEVTHALGVRPEDQVDMDSPGATYRTTNKAAASNTTYRRFFFKVFNMGNRQHLDPNQISRVTNQERRGTKEAEPTTIRAQRRMTKSSLRIL